MQERIVGYGLVIIGIIVMIVSIWQVFAVFTGSQEPYPLFQLKSVSIDPIQLLGGQTGSLSVSSGETKIELFSGSNISKLLNMSVHFFLMSFVMLFGFRLASLGIMFLRPVVVKVREAQSQPASKIPPTA